MNGWPRCVGRSWTTLLLAALPGASPETMASSVLAAYALPTMAKAFHVIIR